MRQTLILLFLAVPAAAVELSPGDLAQMYARGERQRQPLLERREKELEFAKEILALAEQGEYRTDLNTTGYHFEERAKFKTRQAEQAAILAASRRVVDLESDLASLRNRSHKVVPLITDRWLNIGQTGLLPAAVKLVEPMADGSALCSITFDRDHESELAILVGIDYRSVDHMRYFTPSEAVSVTGKRDLDGREVFVIEKIDLPAPAAEKPKLQLPKALIPVSGATATRQSARRP